MWGGKQLYAFIGGGAAGAAFALVNGTVHTWTVPFRCRPIRCGMTITTDSSVGPSTTKFTGAGGTAGNCGTLTIPLTAVAGKAYYENTDYVAAGTGSWLASLDEGEQVTVIVSGSTDASGYGVCWLIVEVDPDMPANNSAMVAG